MEKPIKDDDGKLRYDLVPPVGQREVAGVVTYGSVKYSPGNWREVEPERYVAAALRHIEAYRIHLLDGETGPLDDESRLHHLAHAACCLLFLLEADYDATEDFEERLQAGLKTARRLKAARGAALANLTDPSAVRAIKEAEGMLQTTEGPKARLTQAERERLVDDMKRTTSKRRGRLT